MQEYSKINKKKNKIYMNEHSKTDRNVYYKIQRLARALRIRYYKYNDFTIGLIALLTGQKLLRNYYRRNENNPELLEWRALIFKNLSEFQDDLNKYEINEKIKCSNNWMIIKGKENLIIDHIVFSKDIEIDNLYLTQLRGISKKNQNAQYKVDDLFFDVTHRKEG